MRLYWIAIKTHLGSNNMASKKASFDSRDPSYTSVDTAVDFDSDTAGPIDWKTSDEAAPVEGLIAPDKPLTPGIDASDEGSFYMRDIGSHDTSKTTGETKKAYTGRERRRINRRSQQDRRSDIRFELDKNDRRQHSGRRENDFSSKIW